MIQFLKASGANNIIVLDVNDHNEKIIMEYGATHFINPVKDKDFANTIRKINGTGEGADIVFECAGVPASYMNSIWCARRGGQIMNVGSINEPITMKQGEFSIFELDFQTSFAFTETDIAIFLNSLAKGIVTFPGMVTGVFSLDAVAEKYILADRREHIKGLIDPSL